MAQQRNGFASVFLVSLAIAQGIGWLLAWQTMQWQAKSLAQRVLLEERTLVQEVVLQRDFFQQSKVGKQELRLNGDLYDIRSQEWMGDSVKLVLYHDQDEQALYAVLGIHFSQLDSSTDGAPKPLSVWMAQWISTTFLLPDAVPMPVASEQQQQSFFEWRFPKATGMRVVPFSPPRVA